MYGKHDMTCDMIYVLRCFRSKMYQYAYEFECDRIYVYNYS
jgi:hypothetical protein